MQKRMTELFGVGVPAISKHLKNIFDSGDLEEEVVVSILEKTTEHGTVAERGEYQEDGARRYSVFRLHRGHHRAPQCESVNKFLAFNEYRILEGYGTVSRQQAEQKAFAEYEKFNKQQRIESDFDREVKKLLQKRDVEE
ncbi:TPA: virulence RhuM family protein [Pseudomonas aeruginosa]|nr:virulence RhuM family protein [Pseudomonas aeruginosa]